MLGKIRATAHGRRAATEAISYQNVAAGNGNARLLFRNPGAVKSRNHSAGNIPHELKSTAIGKKEERIAAARVDD